MSANLNSSAPWIRNAANFDDLADWGEQSGDAPGQVSKNTGRLLHKGPDGKPELGLWVCTPGEWTLDIPRDEFCWFIDGHATYVRDTGEVVEVRPSTAVHFPAGWRGRCTVRATMRNTYMLSGEATPGPGGVARVLVDPLGLTEVKDWGVIPTMIEGESRTSGVLIHKGPQGENETGVWICTPGFWNCHVTRDEYCHFLAGRSTYVHESGEVIEIEPDTVAFFPKDWRGTCRVHETIRKVYMIR
jgi:uncharacterized protein